MASAVAASRAVVHVVGLAPTMHPPGPDQATDGSRCGAWATMGSMDLPAASSATSAATPSTPPAGAHAAANPGGRRRLPFSTLAKPTGAACNLECTYCFFLSKEALHEEETQRMSEDGLRLYLTEFLRAQPDGEVIVGWQGGEPTLRGLDFFRRAVELTDELRRPGQRVRHSLQTNATLIDDAWATFLAENDFLVGVSIDGPAHLHDVHRVNRADRGTHSMVVRGWRTLVDHDVDVNVLCTVNSANADHPLEVYRHFRDDLGARHIQFIPVVERVADGEAELAEHGWRDADGARVLYRVEGEGVTSRTVRPAQWGAFMTGIFDEWAANDVGEVFVQHIDMLVGNYMGQYSLCVHAPTCGLALAVEFDNEVYSCDHFVEPGYELGNLAETSFQDMLHSERQQQFGQQKRDGLTAQCRRCPVRWACHGGCPKDRFALSVDGEAGQNYLCRGYTDFFTHATPAVRAIAHGVREGRDAADVMASFARP